MNGRVAVVTGGTGTIGTEICRHLAAMPSRVVALCRPRALDCITDAWEAARKSEGYEMHAMECDVTDFGHTTAVFEDIARKYGGVDVLVNAAGVTSDATLRRMTPEQWHTVLRTNLDGVFNTTRCIIEGMQDRGFGRIINISSVNGQKGQFGQANYAASKAGIHGFTMSVAREVAKKGVTVNTVSPGYIESPMIMSVPEEHRAKILAEIPVGRFGRPSEVARLISFLAGDEAGFITGADFSINGGQHMG
ncbi:MULTISPECIES: acetoacetyl-CoA reductase [Methylocaldum]|jgi:acetoacetyl-CoA reductase|uniref:acetoacetyl-CoA reductase n=1 Tax=unclassified Methylocaldum TaxID=2622260 RepID=UPI00098ACAFF|nr:MULTISPECIES: acetoacetyl-CoA reductase [unclassified Methylocaldum]MBP1150717.1 acetoacetyl-CoA reductase [Methylocaldum sp. RMAD-M]